MATRRQGASGKAGKRADSKVRTGGAKARAERSAGARRARQAAAALELRREPLAILDLAAETAPGPERPQLRLADPPRVEPLGTAERSGAARDELADREAAEIARKIEESAGAAEADLHDLRRRAQEEVARQREEREARRERGDGERAGYGAIVLALLRGALRLLRALATAPLRIGLAVLRPRQA